MRTGEAVECVCTIDANTVICKALDGMVRMHPSMLVTP